MVKIDLLLKTLDTPDRARSRETRGNTVLVGGVSDDDAVNVRVAFIIKLSPWMQMGFRISVSFYTMGYRRRFVRCKATSDAAMKLCTQKEEEISCDGKRI